MKINSRIKILLSSGWTKIFIVLILVASLLLVLFLPLILNARPKGSVFVFNRDANSGTREVFIEKMLGEKPTGFSPSKLNAREVSTNDAMIKNVSVNKDSLGYVSFGTVADFDEEGNPVLRDSNNKINFSTFNNVSPTKENIVSEKYDATRNFNEFFRVDKNSDEAKILEYDWENYKDNTNVISTINNDNLKVSYLFYSWTLYSKNAYDILNEKSEMSESDQSILFTKEAVDKYFESVNLSSKKNLEIEIVGSSSAGTVFSILSNEFKKELNDWGYQVTFLKSNFGSSDAFKKNIPGTKNPYIGLQSREPTENELSKWGWEESNSNSYLPFAKDAVLLIYNNKNLKEGERLNTDTNRLLNVYSKESYFTYKDIFTNYIEGDLNA